MKRKTKIVRPSQRSPAEAALDRLKPLLVPSEFSLLLEELERPLQPSIRLNPLKVSPEIIKTWVERYGWQVQPVPFCPSGWWVIDSQTPAGQTIEHRLGQYYIQDAASMLPVELFDPYDTDAPLTLDLAASPGGKTTHLISRSGDRGMVIANDSSQSRITALRLVLQNWGATSSVVTCFPGERFGGWFPETFDRVLLDAPCSMQGLRNTEKHPMRPITDRERDSLALRQAHLLASAFQALKVGGQVVYSTCTLTPEEDEGVLDGLLYMYPAAVQIEDASRRLPKPAPALFSNGQREFAPQVRGAARLWPHSFGTAGFFAALITKIAPVKIESSLPPFRPWEKTGLYALPGAEKANISASLLDLYGFDLHVVQSRLQLSLWRRDNTVFALPELLNQRFGNLPFQSAGLQVGEFSPDGFTLSHDWAARFEKECPGGRFQLAEEHVPAWLRGEDIRSLAGGRNQRGNILLVEDQQNRFLGRGRLLADRLKNLLPRRLAI